MALGKYKDIDRDLDLILIDPLTGKAEKNSKGEEMAIVLSNPATNTAYQAVRVEANKKARTKSGLPLPEAERLNIKGFVALTKGFKNLELEEGVPFEFSEENATMLYSEYSNIFDQVDYCIGDKTAFLPKPKTPPTLGS